MLTLKVKWSGTEYVLENLDPTSTVIQLKQLIKDQTGVLPERQKLCGISLKGGFNIIMHSTVLPKA